MKLSPIQLERYFLTHLSFEADPAHDVSKAIDFHLDDLTVESDIQPLPGQDRRWLISLRIRLQPRAKSNFPYTISLDLMGVIWNARKLPRHRFEPLVRTNGPSMLYGIAREIVRETTARGPFPAFTLPSVSFLTDPIRPNQNK